MDRMILYLGWNGVHFEWRFGRQDHYLAVKKFLHDLLGGPGGGDDDFFFIETEEQHDALIAFRRKLEREGRTGLSEAAG